MAGERYDLTARVAPFLDAELLKKVQEFNNGAAATSPRDASAGAPASGSAPSLEAAQQLYASGDYAASSEMLGALKAQTQPTSADFETIVWGKLAADLLAYPEAPAAASKPAAASESDEAAEPQSEEQRAAAAAAAAVPEDAVLQSLQSTHEMLDLWRTADSSVQLNRRAWLIHWSLFAYFNGRLPKLVDTFFTSPYMSVIHAVAPWVLRYVAVAVVVTHPRNVRYNRRIKDLTRVVQQELYEYSDAVLDFVKTLYIDYNFADVAQKLQAAAELLANDFFAHDQVDSFTENARVLIADVYLRVHEFVSSESLSKVVGLQGDAGKQFTQRYVKSKQEAKIDAAFDETKDTVRVSYAKPSIYTQVADKVKNIDQRANQIQNQQRN